MAESSETGESEQRPPASRPGTAGPPYSTPRADENYRPPPGLEPEQRPAKRWWSFGRRGRAWDLPVLAAVLIIAVVLFFIFVTGRWW